MTERDRDGKGRYTSNTGSEEVYRAMDPCEPYMTSEISDALGIPRRSAYTYLSKLHDDGKVRKKKPEERRVIWIRLPDD